MVIYSGLENPMFNLDPTSGLTEPHPIFSEQTGFSSQNQVGLALGFIVISLYRLLLKIY